jgi:NitT/TauT family transport system substrate-binding protein
MVDVVDIVRRSRVLVMAAALLLVAVGCGQMVSSSSTDTGPLTLRLGYFPNLTHSPALVGVKGGFFADALGSGVTLETHTFNAGPEAVTALLSGSLDASFMGPNPTVNAFVQSHGEAVRVVAGSTSGGALLVVRAGINSPADLKGKKIADPQLGGTQDVSLRWYLRQHGLHADTSGGGDVSILPQDNATTLTGFREGNVDGGWLPEPWASRLIVEAGAHVLVDERDLWPGGEFVTTNLVVSTAFLRAHPRRVKALIQGVSNSIAYLNSNPAEAQQKANDAVAEITQKKLSAAVVSASWVHMTFTLDPLAATLKASADHAHALGLLPSANVSGLYDLTELNEVLSAQGKPAVASA